MHKKSILGITVILLLISACVSPSPKEENPYQTWSKAAIAVYTLEMQYNRLMTSPTLPDGTKQNLRDEIWPALDEAVNTLELWKLALDAGETPDPIIYKDKINRLISEIENEMPSEVDDED